MNDKDFWMQIRRALMMIVKAIERKYPAKEEILETDASVDYSIQPDE